MPDIHVYIALYSCIYTTVRTMYIMMTVATYVMCYTPFKATTLIKIENNMHSNN